MNSYHKYVSLHKNSCWWVCEIVIKHKPTLHFVIALNTLTTASLDSGFYVFIIILFYWWFNTTTPSLLLVIGRLSALVVNGDKKTNTATATGTISIHCFGWWRMYSSPCRLLLQHFIIILLYWLFNTTTPSFLLVIGRLSALVMKGNKKINRTATTISPDFECQFPL